MRRYKPLAHALSPRSRPESGMSPAEVRRSGCRHAAKSSNAVQTGQKVDHCAAARSAPTIAADAPSPGVGIADTSHFERASRLLALTSSSSGHCRSGLKQPERADEDE